MPNQRRGVVEQWRGSYGFIVEFNGQRWFLHRDEHPRYINWKRAMPVTFDVVGADGRTSYVVLARPA